ncbi:MAG TPA: SAM-dependent methyltransferase, partial [Porphyromonadaceae bacterium]|nr:SAM-dependent methyltransferase [Porphyromonadaceae bacterium]
GYHILSAFGTSDTYIRRYKAGKGNMAKYDGVLIKKKFAYQAVANLELTKRLEEMKADEQIAKQKPRIIAVSDGKTLLAYDTLLKESYENKVSKLWLDFQFFYPLAGVERYVGIEENPADVKAAVKMAKLHTEIRKYNEYVSEEQLHDLNVFMSRLLFCFFAEDTGIFERGLFTNFIQQNTSEDGSDLSESLGEAFQVMDETMRIGQARALAQFPYVNGGLFHNHIAIPHLGLQARRIMLECGELDWGEINPDIFGSMMQAVVTPELRSGLGMHYTSVPNIMKVIQPLFLNELEQAFIDASDNARKLDELLIRMSKMKFFDPACGSGNFLIITYKELRRLEIRIWKRIAEITGIRTLPFSNIRIDQFYGIELDSFAHETAMLSLWLAEHQMNAEFTKAFSHVKIEALPLKNIDHIVQGNACRLNWNEVCPHTPEEEVFVFGNPPYLGSNLHSEQQRAEMVAIFQTENLNRLDYIGCWFMLGAKYIAKTKSKCAFVSTNSITQGVQVPFLWKRIFGENVFIHFAVKSFKWTNNAKYNAGVICVVIGLSSEKTNGAILIDDTKIEKVKSISPYLVKDTQVIVNTVSKPKKGFPPLVMGNKPSDNGNLILNKYEKDELINAFPKSGKFIKGFISADDFINGKVRYCLWIEPKDEIEAKLIPPIKQRTDKLRIFREQSVAQSTRNYSLFDYRFRQISYKPTSGIVVPRVSSERREYIPMGYVDKNTIVSDATNIIYDASILLFGFLTSKIHNIWVRHTAGKLKSDYRYSATLCYNTFPFPAISETKKKEITALSEEVLLVREEYTEKTLAELYDPDKMPQNLRDAHHALDLAVDSCYQSTPFVNDEERLECLFKLYEKITKK